MDNSRLLVLSGLVIGLLTGSASGANLNTNARSVIPADVQQIISVDYRSLRSSASGIALRNRIVPPELSQLEQSLQRSGVEPDQDISQLVFVAVRADVGELTFGIAEGQFTPRQFVARMRRKKIVPEVYRSQEIYPAEMLRDPNKRVSAAPRNTEHGYAYPHDVSITFLDDNTMVFGSRPAVHCALDARNGQTQSLLSNALLGEMIADVDTGTVWSVVDQLGTQNMLRGTFGAAAATLDFESVKKRLLQSRYTLDTSNGVNFRLNIVTSDGVVAGAFAWLLKAGLALKRGNVIDAEDSVLGCTNIDSDKVEVRVSFRADDLKFRNLLDSELFADTLHLPKIADRSSSTAK